VGSGLRIKQLDIATEAKLLEALRALAENSRLSWLPIASAPWRIAINSLT
jgi:hypothetical protein